MNAPMSQEVIERVQPGAYNESGRLEAAVFEEKPSPPSSSLEQNKEKTAHEHVHEVPHLPRLSSSADSESIEPHLVDWDGEADQNHPLNWQRWRKWKVIALGPHQHFQRISDPADAVQSPQSNSCRR